MASCLQYKPNHYPPVLITSAPKTETFGSSKILEITCHCKSDTTYPWNIQEILDPFLLRRPCVRQIHKTDCFEETLCMHECVVYVSRLIHHV